MYFYIKCNASEIYATRKSIVVFRFNVHVVCVSRRRNFSGSWVRSYNCARKAYILHTHTT